MLGVLDYRRLGGASPACPTPPATRRSASFRFRFRFVRAVRAGEAKLRVRVRRASLTLALETVVNDRLRAVWGAIVAGKKHWF